MPRSHSQTEKKPATQRKPGMRRRSEGPRARARPWPHHSDDIPLASLYAPSPPIANTSTTHAQMLYWVALFARMHRPSRGYVPYEFRTLDCPVVRKDGSIVLRTDGQAQQMRCVREIAYHTNGDCVEWVVFSWNVGQVGLSFPSFPTLDEALTHYNAPPSPVCLP